MPNSASPLIIEVCVDSVQSARNAVQGGADRIELCGNLGIGGGTTPSLGLLKAVQQAAVNVPIMAMVRPRIGDFLYSPHELEVMVQDIRLFKQNGVAGVVLGVLKANGRVDVDATQRLVREALPLQVCFHRAFDMARDPNEALRDLVSIEGITRILTSGHGQTAPEALDALKSLCRLTTGGLSILPGSGINSETVRPVLDALLPLGIKELHLSGGGWVGGGMLYRRDNMGMGSGESEWSIWVTSEAKVRNVRHIADEVWGEARGM